MSKNCRLLNFILFYTTHLYVFLFLICLHNSYLYLDLLSFTFGANLQHLIIRWFRCYILVVDISYSALSSLPWRLFLYNYSCVPFMRIQYLFPNILSGTMPMSCDAQILLFLSMFLFSMHFHAFILLSLLQQLLAVTIFHGSSLCDSQSFHSRTESTFNTVKFAFAFFYFLINCFINISAV